jgi:hypothetical protein
LIGYARTKDETTLLGLREIEKAMEEIVEVTDTGLGSSHGSEGHSSTDVGTRDSNIEKATQEVSIFMRIKRSAIKGTMIGSALSSNFARRSRETIRILFKYVS